jgi:hypothetical protein
MHDRERELAQELRTDDLRRSAADPARLRVGALDPSAVAGLQRAAGNAATTALLREEEDEQPDEMDPSSVLDVVGSGGQPLPDDARQSMEGVFGEDFSGVRVHNDPTAQASAKSVQAKAYTVGEDIVLGESTSLHSDDGKKTLAHELTHVVQQRSGPVDGTDIGGGVAISNPADSYEQAAEANAGKVMDALPAASAAGVQREEDASYIAQLTADDVGPEEEEPEQ